MKFIHLSDLHLGKRIYETSLIEDQQHILAQILKIIDREIRRWRSKQKPMVIY